MRRIMRDNQAADDPPIFSATITPHRSLSRSGFMAVMLAVGGASLVTGVVFALIGAWPVFGFFGLDVLLIYCAFQASYRAARAYEQFTVTASEITVRQVSARGRAQEWTFNPLWARLRREEHEEFGLERLFLISHGRWLPIASFLGPDEKDSFARSLAEALAQARRGPTRTVLP
jgi:uncharacterized membrane protein